jgi:hypothetical protein
VKRWLWKRAPTLAHDSSLTLTEPGLSMMQKLSGSATLSNVGLNAPSELLHIRHRQTQSVFGRGPQAARSPGRLDSLAHLLCGAGGIGRIDSSLLAAAGRTITFWRRVGSSKRRCGPFRTQVGVDAARALQVQQKCMLTAACTRPEQQARGLCRSAPSRFANRVTMSYRLVSTNVFPIRRAACWGSPIHVPLDCVEVSFC